MVNCSFSSKWLGTTGIERGETAEGILNVGQWD